MPAPPDDERKPPEDIPDPELNPMTNTLLAQNMGRWAEVYFTTPIEKRDEAVQELLRELKTGNKSSKDSPAAAIIATDEEEILDAKAKLVALEKKNAESNKKQYFVVPTSSGEKQALAEDLVCSACLSKNKAGQRFCGLCGFSLTTTLPVDHPTEETRTTPAPAFPEPIRDGSDWSWLHEKNLSQLAHSEEKSNGWKYSLALILILAVCGAGYWWWHSRLTTNAVGAKTSKEIVEPETRNNSSTDSDRNNTSVEPNSSPAKADDSAPVRKGKNTDAAEPPATSNVPPSPVPSESGSSQKLGYQELKTARAYLEGQGVPRDSALAAKWLWKSVAKQNTEAIVMLSRMYASGDGVPKNCDQARLLLMSAAKKGSLEATEQLRNVISGCTQ